MQNGFLCESPSGRRQIVGQRESVCLSLFSSDLMSDPCEGLDNLRRFSLQCSQNRIGWIRSSAPPLSIFSHCQRRIYGEDAKFIQSLSTQCFFGARIP